MTTLNLVAGTGGAAPKSSRPAGDLHAVPAPWQGRGDQASTGGGNPPAAAGGSLPKPGSMAWLRAMQDDRYKRGAVVRVRGVEGKFFITSAAVNTLGHVMVRVWPVHQYGPRMSCLPSEISFT